MTYKEITKERYEEMLDIMPPGVWIHNKGFLISEATRDRICLITDIERAAYPAFLRIEGRFFETVEPMTVPEFKALTRDQVRRYFLETA